MKYNLNDRYLKKIRIDKTIWRKSSVAKLDQISQGVLYYLDNQ